MGVPIYIKRTSFIAAQFKEATEMLNEIKNNSGIDFDAIQMNADSPAKNCDSFLKFYRKNKEMIHTHHMGHLKSKIDKCVPVLEQLIK